MPLLPRLAALLALAGAAAGCAFINSCGRGEYCQGDFPDSNCESCPAGKTSAGYESFLAEGFSAGGATSSSDCYALCGAGQYRSGGSCYSCAAGTYQASSSHTHSSCTDCPSGQTSAAGSDSASDCFFPTCDSYTFDSTPGSFTDGSGYGYAYADNRDCAWKLECPSGQNVQLSFSSFDTEHNFDFVTLYDGESASSGHRLGRFSGSSRPSTTTSSGHFMRVRFTTDGSVTNSGWSASWSCTSPCAGIDCAHGTCDNALAACVCDRFYFGDKCEERDTCRDVECGSHGSCVQASDDRPGACSCDDGWSGEHCETQDLCFDVECGAHGLCDVSSGQCDCEDGWGGDRCDTISAAASCDGSGGLTLAHRDPGSDPSCNENCNHCSAEQVLAAMAAAPHDYQIQKNGLYALGHQAHGDVASGATIADAGGIGAVMGAMAQFPGDEYVQSDGCFALASLANDSPANQAAIAAVGGAETVKGAMARLSNKGWVQRWCKTALDALAVESCAHECGAHGTCADGQCVCDAGWSGDHCESLAFGATLSGAALGGKQAAVGFCGLGLVGAAVAVRRRMLAGDEAGTLAAPLASEV